MTTFEWQKWMGEEPRRNAPWTPEEEIRCVRMFKSDEPIVCIAQVHGRAIGGIVSRLRQHLGDEEFVSIQQDRLGNRGTYLGTTLPHELVDAEILGTHAFIQKYGLPRPPADDVRRTIAKIREDLNRLERSLNGHR